MKTPPKHAKNRVRKLSTDEIGARRKSPEEIADGDRLPVIAILEDVRSLYNVGSVFRTADAVLLTSLFLTGYTPVPPRKEIDNTALGATRSVPWESVPSTIDAVRTLQGRGWRVCAVENTTTSTNLFTMDPPPTPLALVFGNEITGVRQETLDACDEAWEIPMFGTKHSLNVSVAFGVVLYEVARRLRQR